MDSVSLAEAKAQLSAIIDRVEAGEEVTITRHGKPVARLSAVQQPKRPFKEFAEELAAFRATMPKLRKSSAQLIREMRDESY